MPKPTPRRRVASSPVTRRHSASHRQPLWRGGEAMKTARLMEASFAQAEPEPLAPAHEGATVTLLPVAAALAARTEPPLAAAPAPAVGAWLRARSRLAEWALAAISIGSVILLWYLATKYRLDFYIRFNNIPTPAEVFAKVIEVNRSAKFITSVGISLRRIVLGF